MKWNRRYLNYVMMYWGFYAGFALFTALLSVFLLDQGFSPLQVSHVTATGSLSAMVMQPIVGYLNDRFSAKKVNTVLMILTTLSAIGIIFSKLFIAILMSYGFGYALLVSLSPVLERMATQSPFRYGNIRLWGTVGFAFGTQLGGLLYQAFGGPAVYLSFSLVVLLCLYGFSKIPHIPAPVVPKHEKVPLSTLWSNRLFVRYLIVAAIFLGSTNVMNTYLTPMLVADKLPVNVATLVISISVLIELPLVFYSYLFMDKLKIRFLLLTVFSAFALQFAVYSFVPNVYAKIFVILFFKHTVGMLFNMTNLKIIRTLVSDQLQSRTLAIVSTIGSPTAVLFQNIAGQILMHYSFNTLFLWLFGMALLGLAFLATLNIKDNPQLRLFS
ncbi:MAG: MFS transporter [Aerococcaceae bacterium]|nr:MFS transporter [Aerococcaceae bacterium]